MSNFSTGSPDTITGEHYAVHPGGAHLLSVSTTAGELLFLSPNTEYFPAKPVRGGIPIIGPRFGTMNAAGQPEEPNHGMLRSSAWEIRGDAAGFDAELKHRGINYHLQVTAPGTGLQAQLVATNNSPTSQRIQLGFHPYFAVTDVRKISIHGAGGRPAFDSIAGKEMVEPEEIRITDLTDQIINRARQMRIVDVDRVISVSSTTSDHTVMWNPGPANAAAMDDLGERYWPNFVCVEPALLGDSREGVEVAPGRSIMLDMVVSVSPAHS